MAFQFPSPEWAAAFKDAINANAAYRASAANWTEGAVAFLCQAAPQLGLEEPHAMVLDLRQGSCHGVEHTTDMARLESVPFVIEADYARWKSVIQGDVDPIKAMMQGLLKLSRGHLPTIIRDVESSKQLVLSASHIDTTFLG